MCRFFAPRVISGNYQGLVLPALPDRSGGGGRSISRSVRADPYIFGFIGFTPSTEFAMFYTYSPLSVSPSAIPDRSNPLAAVSVRGRLPPKP